jgi:hypothetical protein
MLRLVSKDCTSSVCCAMPLAFDKASWRKGADWIRGVEGAYGETSGWVLAMKGILRAR